MLWAGDIERDLASAKLDYHSALSEPGRCLLRGFCSVLFLGYWVEGFRVWGLGFRVEALGCGG